MAQVAAPTTPNVALPTVPQGTTILPTDVLPLTGAQERIPASENFQLRLNQLLPSRFYFSTSVETSLRFESNPFQFPAKRDLLRQLPGPGQFQQLSQTQQGQILNLVSEVNAQDWVYRVLPNVAAGWTLTPRTRVYGNFFSIRDKLFQNVRLDTMIYSYAWGVQHDFPIGSRANLQLDLQARELNQMHQKSVFDFLPGLTLSYIYSPKIVFFMNSLMQIRGRQYFQAPTRELDPFYTIGGLYNRGGWTFSVSSTLVQNFRNQFGNHALIPVNSYVSISDFEVARRLFRQIPGFQGFVRAEPIFNGHSHNRPSLAGIDFRLFMGVRMAFAKPALTSTINNILEQIRQQENQTPGNQTGPKPSAFLPQQVMCGLQPIHGYMSESPGDLGGAQQTAACMVAPHLIAPGDTTTVQAVAANGMADEEAESAANPILAERSLTESTAIKQVPDYIPASFDANRPRITLNSSDVRRDKSCELAMLKESDQHWNEVSHATDEPFSAFQRHSHELLHRLACDAAAESTKLQHETGLNTSPLAKDMVFFANKPSFKAPLLPQPLAQAGISRRSSPLPDVRRVDIPALIVPPAVVVPSSDRPLPELAKRQPQQSIEVHVLMPPALSKRIANECVASQALIKQPSHVLVIGSKMPPSITVNALPNGKRPFVQPMPMSVDISHKEAPPPVADLVHRAATMTIAPIAAQAQQSDVLTRQPLAVMRETATTNDEAELESVDWSKLANTATGRRPIDSSTLHSVLQAGSSVTTRLSASSTTQRLAAYLHLAQKGDESVASATKPSRSEFIASASAPNLTDTKADWRLLADISLKLARLYSNDVLALHSVIESGSKETAKHLDVALLEPSHHMFIASAPIGPNKLLAEHSMSLIEKDEDSQTRCNRELAGERPSLPNHIDLYRTQLEDKSMRRTASSSKAQSHVRFEPMIAGQRPSDNLSLPLCVDRIDVRNEISGSTVIPPTASARSNRVNKPEMGVKIMPPLPSVHIKDKKDPFNGSIDLKKPLMFSVPM